MYLLSLLVSDALIWNLADVLITYLPILIANLIYNFVQPFYLSVFNLTILQPIFS